MLKLYSNALPQLLRLTAKCTPTITTPVNMITVQLYVILTGDHSVSGVGLFSFSKDKQTARVAAEFYTNAINVMKGAEAISEYTSLHARKPLI